MRAGLLDVRVERGMRRQLDALRRRIEQGERRLGWKIGFGSPAALESLALDRPLVGFLTDASALPSGSTCDVSAWRRPMLEAEVAVVMAEDLPRGASREDVRRRAAELRPAIELADVFPPTEDVEEILAGNIFHRQVILGRAVPSDQRVRRARVVVNGSDDVETTEPEALTGEIWSVVAAAAATLAAAGESIRSGDVVITGSVVPPLAVRPGDDVVVELDSLEALRVAFAGTAERAAV